MDTRGNHAYKNYYMTHIAKDVATKLAVAVVAVAMALAAFAPAAQAQTTEELQAMINDLLAQVAALSASTGQGATSVASGVCPYTWTRSLTTGSTGADVMKLQQFLNADVDTRVAATGAGSVGAETEYYGPATAAAVSKLQVKYRADVLSPAGLVNPTGYFGPSTMAKANSLCTTAPVVDDMDDEDMDDEDDSSDMTLSGEASLDNFEIDSADDDDIEEDTQDAPVAELTYEFTDGDAEISRIDLQFLVDGETDTSSARPWDAFDTISLWVDGDMIAEEDANDEDDWLDEDLGTFRFSGLDLFAEEDEEVVITVAVTTLDNLDSEELDTWDVYVTATRFFDADGVATTEDTGLAFGSEDDLSGAADASFTIEVAGTDDELRVKTSSSDPDAATLQVEDDSKSDWYTVFVFDLDTDDSINDIELNSIKVNVATTGATYSVLVDDAELVIDGTTIDDVTVDVTGNLAVLTFDVDGDVVIDAGDRVQAELMLRFKSLAPANEGATVQGSVSSLTTSIVDAEGADDLGNSQLGGAATGDAHTLRTTGIDVSPESTSAEVTTGDNAGDDYATFEVEVEITAFEQDVRISTDYASSTSFSIVDGSGNTVTGTSTPVLTSSADENGGFFEINEGSTETLTLQVTFDAATAGAAARLRLNSITFDESGTATNTDDQTQTTLPATDYRTSIVVLTN